MTSSLWSSTLTQLLSPCWQRVASRMKIALCTASVSLRCKHSVTLSTGIATIIPKKTRKTSNFDYIVQTLSICTVLVSLFHEYCYTQWHTQNHLLKTKDLNNSQLCWLVVLRINVDLAIFQPYRYLDLEAGNNQSLKIQVARPRIEPRSSCSASQNNSQLNTCVAVIV